MGRLVERHASRNMVGLLAKRFPVRLRRGITALKGAGRPEQWAPLLLAWPTRGATIPADTRGSRRRFCDFTEAFQLV